MAWSDEAREAAAEARANAASHQNGINDKVMSLIRNSPDGFSVTLHGQQPTNGYMVATQGRQQNIPLGTLGSATGAAVIKSYAEANRDVLSKSGAYLGGWHDKSAGHLVLDVSHNIVNRNAAIRQGVARNQKSIWDVRKGREIPTGGTGE